MGIRDPAVVEVDRFEKSSADRLDDRPFDLVSKTVGVDDGAALERLHHAVDDDAARRALDPDFVAGSDEPSLLDSSGDPEAPPGGGLRSSPAEPVRSGGEYSFESVFLEILQAQFERVEAERVRDFVHVRFAREMVGGGGESTVGALAQRG